MQLKDHESCDIMWIVLNCCLLKMWLVSSNDSVGCFYNVISAIDVLSVSTQCSEKDGWVYQLSTISARVVPFALVIVFYSRFVYRMVVYWHSVWIDPEWNSRDRSLFGKIDTIRSQVHWATEIHSHWGDFLGDMGEMKRNHCPPKRDLRCRWSNL